MYIERYLQSNIIRDLKNKMVFVGGPRQVGKTTMAKKISENFYKDPAYLNWDDQDQRDRIMRQAFPTNSDFIIFDELHKYLKWKNYLKGLYDTKKEKYNILVTGSSRLDVYRKGGDSLMGRYYYLRLHPFSIREILDLNYSQEVNGNLPIVEKNIELRKIYQDLLEFGGFPESFVAKDPFVTRRFQNNRVDRLIKEDIRDLESLRDLSAMQILTKLLPEKVGSLLSVQSLAEDLQTTYVTMAHWLNILENFYFQFRIHPLQFSVIKSLRKQPKMYLWDWSVVENNAARLENMVASHLLKYADFLYDALGFKAELFFVRDLEGREVDFAFCINKKPWFLVEVKLQDNEISKPLKYFSRVLGTKMNFQVVGETGLDYKQNDIRVISADKFLSAF